MAMTGQMVICCWSYCRICCS